MESLTSIRCIPGESLPELYRGVACYSLFGPAMQMDTGKGEDTLQEGACRDQAEVSSEVATSNMGNHGPLAAMSCVRDCSRVSRGDDGEEMPLLDSEYR
eukprot:scaffold2727_cov385-Prasinococcus_capsulatus_cf.AAC.13